MLSVVILSFIMMCASIPVVVMLGCNRAKCHYSVLFFGWHCGQCHYADCQNVNYLYAGLMISVSKLIVGILGCNCTKCHYPV
jgi:hypothetical protein